MATVARAEQPLAPPRLGGKPRKTAPRRVLSREAIIEAALGIIDAEGVDAVTMRRVAEALGTGGASLYAHVGDKDEILEAAFDVVMGNLPEHPRPDGRRWQSQVKDLLRAWYLELLRHKDLARIGMGRVPIGPNALPGMEAMLGLLRAAKLSDKVIAYAVDLLSAYVVSSALEAGMWEERLSTASGQQYDKELTAFMSALPRETFPNIVALVPALMGDEDDGLARFDFGLDVIVKGLAARR